MITILSSPLQISLNYPLKNHPDTYIPIGYYVVGSGNTGVGTSLMAIGGIYAATIMASSLLIRKPAPGYLPAGWTPPTSASGGLEQNVNTNMAMKTPQVSELFHKQWNLL